MFSTRIIRFRLKTGVNTNFFILGDPGHSVKYGIGCTGLGDIQQLVLDCGRIKVSCCCPCNATLSFPLARILCADVLSQPCERDSIEMKIEGYDKPFIFQASYGDKCEKICDAIHIQRDDY